MLSNYHQCIREYFLLHSYMETFFTLLIAYFLKLVLMNTYMCVCIHMCVYVCVFIYVQPPQSV